jgi:hypothetical protein
MNIDEIEAAARENLRRGAPSDFGPTDVLELVSEIRRYRAIESQLQSIARGLVLETEAAGLSAVKTEELGANYVTTLTTRMRVRLRRIEEAVAEERQNCAQIAKNESLNLKQRATDGGWVGVPWETAEDIMRSILNQS